MIAAAAAAALALDAHPEPADPAATGGGAAHVRRLRARMARDVAVMLGVPAARVIVTDDLVRYYGGHAWHLITVHDPDDPAPVYRLVPEVGLGGLYLLLDECPDCTAPGVPMTTVAGLADLGRYLAATQPVPRGALDPDDEENGRPDLPEEFFGDPGHHGHCAIGRVLAAPGRAAGGGSGGPAARPDAQDFRAVAAYLAASPSLEAYTADRLAHELHLPLHVVAEALETLGAGGEAELVATRPARQWRATTWTPQVASGRPPRAGSCGADADGAGT
ncbi:hypothetical protein [Pseudonocardia sp. MH-G8]|uniref:hypothetical protein n=1 Tax=Pseudonocardia sp. MH-G8 TaxID=1854588 RepID=UPI000BA06C21|nr:hypothetical protein [Pseudonocardia sp. MH-G8]OZM76578.1 hypothetical protein CFP66_40490 [Pseudonocardia sp. MH-G8]